MAANRSEPIRDPPEQRLESLGFSAVGNENEECQPRILSPLRLPFRHPGQYLSFYAPTARCRKGMTVRPLGLGAYCDYARGRYTFTLMLSSALRSGLAALVLAGCTGDEWPAPSPVSFDDFAPEHQDENRLRLALTAGETRPDEPAP